MTPEQQDLLKKIAEELGGTLHTSIVIDKYKQHKQIVIEYAKQKR